MARRQSADLEFVGSLVEAHLQVARFALLSRPGGKVWAAMVYWSGWELVDYGPEWTMVDYFPSYVIIDSCPGQKGDGLLSWLVQ